MMKIKKHTGAIGRYDYAVRLGVIIFALIYPLICLFYIGYKPSLSQYWNTPMQPIFIFSNAATSYYLIGLKNWRISSCLLTLVTAFSIEYYPTSHNVLAVAFFVFTLWPLYKTNNFKYCFWIYICAIPIAYFSLLFAEYIAIVAMCIFHIMSLVKLNSITKERLNINYRD